jgi:hypothetical protein
MVAKTRAVEHETSKGAGETHPQGVNVNEVAAVLLGVVRAVKVAAALMQALQHLGTHDKHHRIESARQFKSD